MARGQLGLSEIEFWETTPRTIMNMIREWRNIEIGRNKLATYIANGNEIEMDYGNGIEDDAQTVDARFL